MGRPPQAPYPQSAATWTATSSSHSVTSSRPKGFGAGRRMPEGTGEAGEEWFEFLDPPTKRFYYVEARTNRTQWIPPTPPLSHTSLSMARNENLEVYLDTSLEQQEDEEDDDDDLAKHRRNHNGHEHKLRDGERILAFTDAAVAIAITLLILPLMESAAELGNPNHNKAERRRLFRKGATRMLNEAVQAAATTATTTTTAPTTTSTVVAEEAVHGGGSNETMVGGVNDEVATTTYTTSDEVAHDDESSGSGALTVAEWFDAHQHDIFLFVTSFGVIFVLWSSHERLFRHVGGMTRLLSFLNFCWLLGIAWIPVSMELNRGVFNASDGTGEEDKTVYFQYFTTLLYLQGLAILQTFEVIRNPRTWKKQDLGPRWKHLVTTVIDFIFLVIAMTLSLIPSIGYWGMYFLLLSYPITELICEKKPYLRRHVGEKDDDSSSKRYNIKRDITATSSGNY